MEIVLNDTRNITRDQILPLYEANAWSAVQKPDLLLKGLINSHSLITAWDGDILEYWFC